ncbi:predicted protein [Histoplasma mississippiense (nom. inval.)]|uniref:predicted protein n=1 Tax=Ajellomyces capsulatus (strain NAm1 / WU24) TaxID=2059318 RepID=UPI000157B6B6|nr:predicted protein [Histoplasma mississippiense (nom. inval.)]EDN03167.1 predicted protein [Histoplasma mississippiense (nom. inval.)]
MTSTIRNATAPAPAPAPAPASTNTTTPPPTADDPVIASYDIYITDSQIRRFLLQYPDRQATQPYNAATHQKPTELRLKPRTGLVEVDIPINTHVNYDEKKGRRYGNALRRSRVIAEGGTMGMAGGFNPGARAKGLTVGTGTGAGAGVVGVEDEEDEITTGKREETADFLRGMRRICWDYEDEKAGVIMTTQTLEGKIKGACLMGTRFIMLGGF